MWLQHTDRNFIRAMTVGEELKLAGLLAAHLQVQKPNMTITVYLVYDPRVYHIGYKFSEILIDIKVKKNRYSVGPVGRSKFQTRTKYAL